MENNNQNENHKPEAKIYKAEIVEEQKGDIYRERTTTIKETEIIRTERPRSSMAQIILAVCAFLTVAFAIYDKVIQPKLAKTKAQQTVVTASGLLKSHLLSCKNNSKFVLIDCSITNQSDSQNVTIFSEGKLIDDKGKSTSQVFVQSDGSKTFNISDIAPKEIEMPKDVPLSITLMYDIQTKEDISYASFNTSLGKIEFRDIIILE